MYNNEILDHLITKYGIDDVIKFCDMESEKNDLLAQSVNKNYPENYPEPNEWGFERDWWAESGKQLKQRI
jgi:hypothetical protein